jgi:putative two-component system response regulator
MQAIRPGDVLVIESDASYASLLQSVLAARGHSVTLVATAREAQVQLQRFTFDVVLCALRLSDADGAAVCNAIKSSAEFSSTSVGLILDSPADLITLNYRASGLSVSSEGEKAQPDEMFVRTLSMEDVSLRVQSLMRLGRYHIEIQNSIRTLMRVAEGVEEQDSRMSGHCKRLSLMAVELGAVLGCDEWQLSALERAGYLHDIGRVSIPGAIIDKTQRLSPREMEIIQNHSLLGERLCADVAALKPVLPIIRHHHERADGTGYPDRLKGEQIPILAQIFSIPDIYDALRMWRPYRPPMNQAQALDIMRQEVARGYWNRIIFDAFADQVIPDLDARLEAAHCLWPVA